jgi:predicted transcriptional regulator
MGKWGSALGWWRATKHPLHTTLGHLERDVMEVLWRASDGNGLPVRDVQARLGRKMAYTTVMTTLDRLFKKGLATRRREGRAFLYTAGLAEHEIETTLTAGLVDGLLAGEAAAPLLSNLVDVVGNRDDRLLDELERLVKDKKASLKWSQK